MIIQCPKCKKIYINGKFIKNKHNMLIPGAYYKLCPECKRYINVLEINSFF